MLCKTFVDQISKKIEMSMFGDIKIFIGLKFNQTKNGIYVTQFKYVKEILKIFGMDKSRLVGTRMVTRVKLSKKDTIAEVNETQYKSMIGKL